MTRCQHCDGTGQQPEDVFAPPPMPDATNTWAAMTRADDDTGRAVQRRATERGTWR